MTPTQPYAYEWREWKDDDKLYWGLLLTHESNNNSLSRIAFIYRDGKGQWHASYYWPHSRGHKSSGWCFLKTTNGCRRWVERQLAGFWEPPTIVNPVSKVPA